MTDLAKRSDRSRGVGAITLADVALALLVPAAVYAVLWLLAPPSAASEVDPSAADVGAVLGLDPETREVQHEAIEKKKKALALEVERLCDDTEEKIRKAKDDTQIPLPTLVLDRFGNGSEIIAQEAL